MNRLEGKNTRASRASRERSGELNRYDFRIMRDVFQNLEAEILENDIIVE